jgi:hypothetical protein
MKLKIFYVGDNRRKEMRFIKEFYKSNVREAGVAARHLPASQAESCTGAALPLPFN